MTARFPLFCLALAPLLSGCGDFDPPRTGDPAPELTATGLDGSPFTWENVPAGKACLLQFYANSCCADQIPATSELYREYRGKGLSAVAINVLDSADSVREQIDPLAPELPVALDRARSTSGRYGLARLPTTFLLDGDRIVRARIVGQVSRDELARQVEPFLNPSPVANPEIRSKIDKP